MIFKSKRETLFSLSAQWLIGALSLLAVTLWAAELSVIASDPTPGAASPVRVNV